VTAGKGLFSNSVVPDSRGPFLPHIEICVAVTIYKLDVISIRLDAKNVPSLGFGILVDIECN
jgi:hypothetical protein